MRDKITEKHPSSEYMLHCNTTEIIVPWRVNGDKQKRNINDGGSQKIQRTRKSAVERMLEIRNTKKNIILWYLSYPLNNFTKTPKIQKFHLIMNKFSVAF